VVLNGLDSEARAFDLKAFVICMSCIVFKGFVLEFSKYIMDYPSYSVQITSVSMEGETNLLYQDISQQNIERIYSVMSHVQRPGDRYLVNVYKTGQPHAIKAGFTGQTGLDTISDCVDVRKRQRMTQDMQEILSALHERLLAMESRTVRG
jgi:hypothetical protein